MTTTPGDPADIERELTERLTRLARAFVADLKAQGRLVETSGADALERLQEPEPGSVAEDTPRVLDEPAGAPLLGVARIASAPEHVTVHIHALSLNDWEHWLTTIGAPLDAPAHPTGRPQAATEPFYFEGRLYDLARGHIDRHGQTWYYHGRCQEDGTPLLAVDGANGPSYPLTSIITANGPLTPAASNLNTQST